MRVYLHLVFVLVVLINYEAVANHFQRMKMMKENLTHLQKQIQNYDDSDAEQALKELASELEAHLKFLDRENNDLIKALLDEDKEDTLYHVADRYFSDLEAISNILSIAAQTRNLTSEMATKQQKLARMSLTLALKFFVFDKKAQDDLTETEQKVLTYLVSVCS